MEKRSIIDRFLDGRAMYSLDDESYGSLSAAILKYTLVPGAATVTAARVHRDVTMQPEPTTADFLLRSGELLNTPGARATLKLNLAISVGLDIGKVVLYSLLASSALEYLL